MSRDGYLPPGCTERDVDNAAPQDECDPRDDEERYVVESEMSIRHAAESLISAGYRAVVMDVFNDIIKEYALDTFKGHDHFYRHYRGEAAE